MSEINPFAKQPKIDISQNPTENFNRVENIDLSYPSDLLDSGSEDFSLPPVPPKLKPKNTRSANPILAPPLLVNPRRVRTGSNPELEFIKRTSKSQTSEKQSSIDSQLILNTTSSSVENSIKVVGERIRSICGSIDSIYSSNSLDFTETLPSTNMSVYNLATLLPTLGPHDDIASFVLNCEALLSLLQQENEKTTLVTFIRIKLEGSARKAVESSKAVTWGEIKRALESLSPKTRPVEEIQAELIARTQRPGESIEKFGEAMFKLLADLTKSYANEISTGEQIPDSILNINERQALRAFESGIRSDQLRMLLFLNKSKTLTEAIKCATTFESRTPKKAPSPSSASTVPVSNNINNNRPVCEYCRKVGHTVQNCYLKKEIKTENPGEVCRYCKQPGHVINNCRARKENNSRYRGNDNWTSPRNQVHHFHTSRPNQLDPRYFQTNRNQFLPKNRRTNFVSSENHFRQNHKNSEQSFLSNSQTQPNSQHDRNQDENPTQVQPEMSCSYPDQGNGSMRAGEVDSPPRIQEYHNL